MEKDNDLARQNSIEQIIQRGIEERNNLIAKIESLLNDKIPFVFEQVQAIIDNFAEISYKLNLSFNSQMNIEELRKGIIEGLNSLKKQLEELDFEEEEMISNTLIGDSIDIVESVENRVNVIPNKILEAQKNQLLGATSDKEKKDKEKQELEKQEMFLKGKQEATLLGKKKADIQIEIDSIRNRINALTGKKEEDIEVEF